MFTPPQSIVYNNGLENKTKSCNMGTINGGIVRWDMSKDKVGVAVEKSCTKLFREEISKVDGCINTFQVE